MEALVFAGIVMDITLIGQVEGRQEEGYRCSCRLLEVALLGGFGYLKELHSGLIFDHEEVSKVFT